MRIRTQSRTVSARTINCKKATDWKAVLVSHLKEGKEVSLLNFDYTNENQSHCEAVAESYGMILKANRETAAVHFFRD